MIEYLAECSIETGSFDKLAILDVMMTIIEQIIAAGKDKRVLILLKKIAEVRNNKLGELDPKDSRCCSLVSSSFEQSQEL